MKFRISLGWFGLAFLIVVAMSGNALAVTDVNVYESSRQGGGVSVASLDAAGVIVDEQTVLVGQKVTGIRQGQPVPQPVAMSSQEMNEGLSNVNQLKEVEIEGQVNAKLEDLKRRIS